MLRALYLAVLLAPALSVAGLAQTLPAPSSPAAAVPPPPAAASHASRGRGADISRDEYIQRAVERARHAAETRFDRMDANHDGVLTADERRAGRAAKRGGVPQ